MGQNFQRKDLTGRRPTHPSRYALSKKSPLARQYNHLDTKCVTADRAESLENIFGCAQL